MSIAKAVTITGHASCRLRVDKCNDHDVDGLVLTDNDDDGWNDLQFSSGGTGVHANVGMVTFPRSRPLSPAAVPASLPPCPPAPRPPAASPPSTPCAA